MRECVHVSLGRVRMAAFLHKVDSHISHDDMWCIVSTDNQLPLCIACLVEHLEEQSLTNVQKQFKLSLLANIIKENEEALQLFRENPLVCQHILEIVTEHYTGNSFMADSVQICVQLMDAVQSEELYVYLLDKFQSQVQSDTSAYTFVVGLLGKLSAISSAYVLTLILSHERLLHLLLEIHHSTDPDEASNCCLLYLLTRLFDVDILPAVPPTALPLVEQYLVHCLTSPQPEDVHVNAVALLKCLLRTECCLGDDSGCWAELLLGLKRLFVSKKDTLVIAATQCLLMIASSAGHARVLHSVLEGDLSEFLFEALHTLNAAQLETVFRCLLLFSEHDQFYKKCHAVYGLESVLRSLDVVMETQNVTVLGKGFTLLSNVLQKQPSTIPVLVNLSAAELTISVVTKGVRCHAMQVVLPALRAATALFKDPKVSRQQFTHYRHVIVEAALSQVTRAVRPSTTVTETPSALSTVPVTDLQLLTVLLSLLTAALTSGNKEQDADEQMWEVCRDCIVPYFTEHFTTCDNSSQRALFSFLNSLYKNDEAKTQDISEKALASGLAVQVLMKKPDLSSDLELLRSASIFVENLFHTLVKAECTKCYSLPDYLASGLRQLSFRSSIGQTVSDLRDTDTAAALCMVLYFSCLNEQQMFSPTQIGQILWQLHEKGLLLQCTPQRPLTAKFLLYLLAFADSSEEGDNLSPVLQNAESNLVQLAVSEQSVEHWATPHPHVFLWVFATLHRAQHLGASLLEHWLLHTKGRIQTAGQDGGDTGRSHVVCTLFLNPHFRLVLFSLMTSSSEEISVLSGKLFVTLITSNTGRSDEQSHQLARLLYGEVMSQFQSLFVLSVQPLRHVVNSFLQTLVAVLQHPMCEPSEADLNKQIGVVYHLVHHIGTSDSEDSELLYNGMISLDCLSKTTDEEQDRTVVPILLQNAKFMQQLERCLFRDEQLISSVALSIVAWISSSSSSCQTDQPITLDAEFILRIIMRSANKQAVAALKILYLSLSQSSLDLNSPLSFHSSHTFHQAGSLYSLQELRLLFTYVQQYVCLEDKEIQFCAVKCYLEILNHSKLFDSAQGDGLLHHPWTPHLLHFVLTNTASSGLELHTAEFIHQIWCQEANSGQAEVAKLVLESVLVTEISAENQDLLQLLVQKAKTDCPEDDLWEQAALKLSAFDTCLSSQNTMLST